jgi:hypothetical protein
MLSNSEFTGVSVAGMLRTLRVSAAVAHPAFHAHDAWAPAGAAAAITPQRKRRTATATGASVDWGNT